MEPKQVRHVLTDILMEKIKKKVREISSHSPFKGENEEKGQRERPSQPFQRKK